MLTWIILWCLFGVLALFAAEVIDEVRQGSTKVRLSTALGIIAVSIIWPVILIIWVLQFIPLSTTVFDLNWFRKGKPGE